MNMRSDTVADRFAGRAAAPTSPEGAARPSCQPQPPPAEATAAQQPPQVMPATRNRFRWTIALAGVVVLLAGSVAAKRITLYRPPVVVSYNTRLAELDTKLSRGLAAQLREAGFSFDAAIVSVEGPACQQAVCLVRGLRRGDLSGIPCPLIVRHVGKGSWSFAGMGGLAELKFSVDAEAEMRRLAESTPPQFPQVPSLATPIQSQHQTVAPFTQAFELWLSARTGGRQGQWLDLETGRCLTEPDWEYLFQTFNSSHWLRSNSLDLTAAVYPDGSYWLYTRDLAVVPVDARLWDEATPDKLASHPALRSARNVTRGSFSSERDQTDTYLFRAEEGSIGILRVLELNRASQELKIQYKLAPPAAKADA